MEPARRRPATGAFTSTAAAASTRVNSRAPPGKPLRLILPGKPAKVAHGDRLPATIRAAPRIAAGTAGTRTASRSTCSSERSCPRRHPLAQQAGGRKTSTPMRTTKATASFHDEPWGRYWTAMTSTIPRMNPPSTAPLMLPIPPRTAAVNAFSPTRNPIRKSIWPKRMPCITPATPASAAPRMKVTTMILSVSMPISFDVSGSWAVARMARPVLVRRTNACSATISATAVTTTNTETHAMVTSATWNVPVISRGNACCRLPPG